MAKYSVYKRLGKYGVLWTRLFGEKILVQLYDYKLRVSCICYRKEFTFILILAYSSETQSVKSGCDHCEYGSHTLLALPKNK